MTIYDEILAGLNEDVAKVNSMKFTDYEKAAIESLAEERQAEQNTINTSYDSAKANTQAVYDQNLADTKTAYESKYQRNAVQKLINEKKIAETNANLGLTDSGLNRTQQTAAQLSYANQKGDLDIARQKAIDNMTLELSAALTKIENNRNSDLLYSDQKWNSEARSIAQTNYNNDLTAYNNRITSAYEQLSEIDKARIAADADVQKAVIEAGEKAPTVSYGAGGTSTGGYIVSSETGTLSRDYKGSLKDNGVFTVYSYNDDGSIKSVTYTDSNSGISATFDGGVNPYTGTMNKDVRGADGYYDPSRVFDNGYQPNNIDGEKLYPTDASWTVYDREQKVFELKSSGEFYVWRGDLGKYQKLTDEEARSVGLIK